MPETLLQVYFSGDRSKRLSMLGNLVDWGVTPVDVVTQTICGPMIEQYDAATTVLAKLGWLTVAFAYKFVDSTRLMRPLFVNLTVEVLAQSMVTADEVPAQDRKALLKYMASHTSEPGARASIADALDSLEGALGAG